MDNPLFFSENASAAEWADTHGLAKEVSPALRESDDEGYSSIQVDDPGEIETLLSRYDLLLHDIHLLDQQVQFILKEPMLRDNGAPAQLPA